MSSRNDAVRIPWLVVADLEGDVVQSHNSQISGGSGPFSARISVARGLLACEVWDAKLGDGRIASQNQASRVARTGPRGVI